MFKLNEMNKVLGSAYLDYALTVNVNVWYERLGHICLKETCIIDYYIWMWKKMTL